MHEDVRKKKDVHVSMLSRKPNGRHHQMGHDTRDTKTTITHVDQIQLSAGRKHTKKKAKEDERAPRRTIEH